MHIIIMWSLQWDESIPSTLSGEWGWLLFIFIVLTGDEIMRWKERLTKKQLKHLKEMDVTTYADLKTTLDWQAMERKNTESEPCWECREIAARLDIPILQP